MLSRFRCVGLFVTPWSVACQAPLSMGSSRQEYWSGLPCPPPGDLPDPGIKPETLMPPALAVGGLCHKRLLGTTPHSNKCLLLQEKARAALEVHPRSVCPYAVLDTWPCVCLPCWSSKKAAAYLLHCCTSLAPDFIYKVL